MILSLKYLHLFRRDKSKTAHRLYIQISRLLYASDAYWQWRHKDRPCKIVLVLRPILVSHELQAWATLTYSAMHEQEGMIQLFVR